MEREVEAIAGELHCSSVLVFGSELERIALAAGKALERGLRVTVQPRSIDADEPTVPYPHLADPPERSDATQARDSAELLQIFEAEAVHEACVFQFVEPAYPHAADPHRDLDRAGFALVKTLREDPADPDAAYRIEPKQAFHAVAASYGARCGRDES